MLTPKEVQKQLIGKKSGKPVSYPYVIYLLKTGILPSTKKGRNYFIKQEDLEKFKKENNYE